MNNILNKRTILASLFSLLMLIGYAEREKVVQIFRGGEVVQEYAISDIDYIEVNDRIESPSKVEAEVDEKSITITWNAVEGATYNIYRSADNVNFTLLAKDLKETSYTDSEPLSGSNFYKVKAIVDGQESAYTQSAAASFSDTELPSGVYLGITAFNDGLYKYPVHLLTERSVEGFFGFIDGLEIEDVTMLYYAFDKALDALQASKLPSDLTTAAIITFTDGLDQGTWANDDVIYDTKDDYLNAMKERITTEKVGGDSIIAYSIGLRGKDVDASQLPMFRKNLSMLASSPENVSEVTSMSEVNAKFKEIAEKLTESNYMQTINLNIPVAAPRTRLRFSFDNISKGENSSLYIEGVYNRDNASLEEVEYHGMSSTSGTTVKGTKNGSKVLFTFEEVYTEDNILIKQAYTDEWEYISSDSYWQKNSEFNKKNDADIVYKRSSAAIMLVLDCSSSLAEDFVMAQNNAKDFITTLYNAVNENPLPEPGDDPDKEPYGMINGHEYVDLGLPSGLKWATCNVGADSPSEYGNYYAWGETTTKSSYDERNSKTRNKLYGDISGNPDDDAARANWGSTWRMPTKVEMQELIDKCKWELGSGGYKVTGPNGNSIFLPATGWRLSSYSNYVGSEGGYWSSTPNTSIITNSYLLRFDNSYIVVGDNYYRHCGWPVRPVSE